MLNTFMVGLNFIISESFQVPCIRRFLVEINNFPTLEELRNIVVKISLSLKSY